MMHLLKVSSPSEKQVVFFSNMGIDQAHEQNNKILKDDGGIIGILNNPTALLKWAICGTVICQMLKEGEETDDGHSPSLHHEDNDTFEEKFQHDRELLVASFQEQGNPFEEYFKNCSRRQRNKIGQRSMGERK